MEEYYHLYAIVMLYAAVYGPATFNERFGRWEQAVIQSPASVAHPNPVKLGLRLRSKKHQPLDLTKFCNCKGPRYAGSS